MRQHRLTAQKQASDVIKRKTEEFLANGGKVDQVSHGATGVKSGVHSFVTAADRARALRGAKKGTTRKHFD